jgi:hypothetical protein
MIRLQGAWLPLLFTIALAACDGHTTTDPGTDAAPVSATVLQSLALSHVVECPPEMPPGYSSRFCFDVDLYPGVLHGFVVAENTLQPPFFEGIRPGLDYDPENFVSDYLLVSPTGFERITWREFPFDGTRSVHFFQTEYFMGSWLDVLRISLSTNEVAPRHVTLAVAERAITPSAQAGAIARQVEALLAGGSLNSGQATALLATLEEAIRLLETGATASAANLLRAFTNQVIAFSSGRRPALTADQAASLTAAAEAVMARIAE